MFKFVWKKCIVCLYSDLPTLRSDQPVDRAENAGSGPACQVHRDQSEHYKWMAIA